MRSTLLAVLLACESAAAAASGTFSVHLVTGADAPGAKAWRLALPGGAVEEMFLAPAALLDETAVASADASRGPGGDGEIRLVLTPGGARTLAEVTARNVGRRLGIVVAGRLRSAPVVVAGVTNGVLLVGGLNLAETEALARTLGPPAPKVPVGPAISPDASRSPVALLLLEGSWGLVSATANGQTIPDPKFASGTWTFHGGTLDATNGAGEKARFALETDAAAPDAFLLTSVPPSRERGGWMIFRREGDRLSLAFFDGFSSRPEDFTPAPKKVVLVFAPRAGKASR